MRPAISVRGTHNYTERMLATLASLPAVALAAGPSPVESLDNLRDALGSDARLLVKRDDTIGFAFGGNKVRKMQLVAAHAKASGADTLITTGGVQSNHARVTAAAAAKLRMKCVLVVNGTRPAHPTGNALLDQLLGAEVRYVRTREDRATEMERAAEDVRQRGARPYIIPLGASTPLGAAAFVAAIGELADQVDPPDVIIHASSSGGTQAGLIAGCALAGWHTRVIGISADEPAASLEATVRELIDGLAKLLDCGVDRVASASIVVDDGFVGEGYGIPTMASREAADLAARTEALFVDHTYTAKALAGLVSRVRDRTFTKGSTVLFWHTGGQVGLFA